MNRRRSRDAGEPSHSRLAMQERVRQMLVLERLCSRYHLVAAQLQSRHDGRPAFLVHDEFDVQDLLRALLTLEHDEVRPERTAPGHAEGRAHTALVLGREQIVVEAKMAGPELGSEALGSQLAEDVRAHMPHADCRTLVCFVYDPERRLARPHVLEDALSVERDGLKVRVLIAPKGP